MSRAHDRAYRLLADRVRLRNEARYALYATLAATILTGLWWLAVHYGSGDELRRLAAEALALKIHGAASFAILIGFGAMSASHVRRGWSIARNRWSGSVVVGVFAVLMVSGYALYYLVDDGTRPAVSLAHWATGVGLAPILVAHIVAGRRSRRGRRSM
jgi:hypothetical protein